MCAPLRAAASNGVNRSQPGNQFTARPYNPYEADTSDWWVVPSTDWPAFHHGKFGFSSQRPVEPGHLLVGVNVEKGFSPRAVQELGKPHTWAINSTWVWPEFLGALRASELGAGASDLKRLSGVDPWMHVEASYAEDRPIDPREGTPRADLLDFTISAGSLRLIRHDALHGLLSDLSLASVGRVS